MDLSGYIAKIRYLIRSITLERAGRGGSIGSDVKISRFLSVSLGDRVTLRSGVALGGRGALRIGSNTTINAECMITAMQSVTIGRDVLLAPRVYILDVDHEFDRRDIPIRLQGYKINPVTVGDDVWIGTGVVVTKGVKIGSGAVIGANSVVTSDVPPYAVAAGVPARVIRYRKQ